ncbi:MAG: flagellar protein FlgN [Acidimicrobiales bacterium]
MGFDDVSVRLWHERRVLEMLVFKLEEEHLVLASGRHNWLAHATAEVEQVLEALKTADDSRAEAVLELAGELGLGPQPTLDDLAGAAPAPWGDILSQHRRALLATLEHIQEVSAHNREILARGIAATADALALMGEQPGSAYGADGAPSSQIAGARLVNATL